MKKKIILTIIVATMVAMTACGKKEDTPEKIEQPHKEEVIAIEPEEKQPIKEPIKEEVVDLDKE